MLITLTGYPAKPGLGNIMSDMVESMSLDVSVLGASWHGLENPFNGAMTAKEALTTAGIDWTVDQAPVFVDGKEVPGFKANIRSKDSLVLGFVSDVYRPIQNYEAFDFVEKTSGRMILCLTIADNLIYEIECFIVLYRTVYIGNKT